MTSSAAIWARRRATSSSLETGKKIGEHRGFWFHTIGQRKGLGLSGGPWYVVKKNVADNTIYVSRGYDTDKQYGKTLHLDEMHFISGNPWEGQTEPVDIMFKNRHTPVFMKARFVPLGGREYVIESEEKVQGIAPDSCRGLRRHRPPLLRQRNHHRTESGNLTTKTGAT